MQWPNNKGEVHWYLQEDEARLQECTDPRAGTRQGIDRLPEDCQSRRWLARRPGRLRQTQRRSSHQTQFGCHQAPKYGGFVRAQKVASRRFCDKKTPETLRNDPTPFTCLICYQKYCFEAVFYTQLTEITRGGATKFKRNPKGNARPFCTPAAQCLPGDKPDN